MIRKMRWRFIRGAMAAFSFVLLLVAGVINIGNYLVTTAHQDEMIQGIYRMEQKDPPVKENGGADEGTRRLEDPRETVGFPELEHIRKRQPEFEFTTRFFLVRCDEQGKISGISRDYIASVTEETAEEYAGKVLQKENEAGYYRHYRYHVFETGEGKLLIFLNCDAEYEFMENLLLTSGIVLAVSLFAVFLLIFLLSRRAVAPFADNVERQKRFITDAGHELKTPITSISTSADVLEMFYGGDEWTENIHEQTERLAKLVENLITLSRLDEELPFPEKALFSLSEAARESSRPFEAMACAMGKQYIQNIADGLELYGDLASVQKMITILLDNAVKYCSEGGTVRFSVNKKHGKITIETVNTCQRETALDLEHLFDRFYRPDTSRSRKTGGTGIGLSIARAVAEAHGGKLTAEYEGENAIRFRAVL